ncbi:LytR/AlgR family response regulator transcription factor [Thermodesulfovibrio hydrogeniphilus]
MKVLVIDDEPLAVERLMIELRRVGEFIISAFTSASSLLDELSKDKDYDIAFVDIKMPEISGLELAQKINAINPNIFIVFVTAFPDYALDAFKIGAIYYILKPYSTEEIKRVVERAKSYMKRRGKSFLIKDFDGSYKIVFSSEIYYIKAELKDCVLRTAKEFYYYPAKISDLERVLSSENFERVHRSYLINLEKVSKIKTVHQSKLEFYFKDIKDTVLSSKEGAKIFREKYKNLEIL